MMENDETKQLLENILASLYKQEASETHNIKIKDSYIQAGNNEYLGTITKNKFDKDSILNVYGPYGSKYSPNSIFNQYGQYGGLYSHQSAYNQYASSPPSIRSDGKEIGKLTKNKNFSSHIDPDELKDWAINNRL